MSDQEEQDRPRGRVQKGRSPSFPAIDLGTALARTRMIWEREGKHPVPISLVFKHWKYAPKSSGAAQTVAALRKFGLITVTGQGDGRMVSVTDEARRIILDERPESTERQRLVQAAAMRPLIHQELREQYGAELPSDETLRHHLVLERGFLDSGARDLISELRATLEFAELNGALDSEQQSVAVADSGDATIEVVSAGAGVRETPSPVVPSRPSPDVRAIQIPLSATKWATLQAPFPIAPDEWKRMMVVLEAMEPALAPPASAVELDDSRT